MSTYQPTFIIQLHNLHFFGYHGLYEEEKILGNEFEVSIWLKVKAPEEQTVSIHDTINYTTVYKVVKDVFNQREELLETICINMSNAIKNKFPELKKLSIQIVKLHPPITGFAGSVSVTYEKNYQKK